MLGAIILRAPNADLSLAEKAEMAVEISFRFYHLPTTDIRIVTAEKAPACYKNVTLIKLHVDCARTEGLLIGVVQDITERAKVKDLIIEIDHPNRRLFKNGVPYPAP